MADAEQRAAERRKRWTGGVASSPEEMERVDLAFWRRTEAALRLKTVWSLVEDSLALEGKHGPTPRLQRSVGGVRPLRG